MNKYKEYLGVSLIVVTLISILFYKFINGNYIFASGDTLAPQAIKHGIESIIEKTGKFPYWFPYIFSGIPTVHSLLNINEFYFPHKIINFFHSLGLPWIWNFLLHYLFSAIGMYSLSRFLKQSKTSALFVSILFALSPYMIAYLVHGHGSQIMTASYIPWIILFIFKIHEKVNIMNFSCLSLLVGLQLQRGHIQIAYYTWMLAGLFILVSFLFNYKKDIKIAAIKFCSSVGSLFIGFLLSLSIYYPVLNYTAYSVRGVNNGGYGIENATQWSLHIKEFFTFIMPYSYGFGGQYYWGFLPFTDFPNYIGIFIFFLAIIGLFKIEINKTYKTFFILVIFISLLLSLGKYFQNFYTIFYNYLPFFNKFRAPIFILIIFQFCVYLLAGFGIGYLPDLLKRKVSRINIFISFIAMFLIILATNFYSPKLYPVERFNGKEIQFFNEVKKSYHELLANKDLNNDGLYNDIDINLLNRWTESESRLYYSYLKLMQSNKTDKELISILRLTDSDLNKVQQSLDRDQILILSILCLFILLSYAYSNYTFITKSSFLFIIIVILTYDYVRVNKDIINPEYHIPNKKIVKHKSFINQYLKEDELTNFLSLDLDKFRVLDLTGNNTNRFAAFNIETITGYHPAKLWKYDKILNIIRAKGYYPEGLLQALNVKYIIHNKVGNIPNFSKLDSKFISNYYGDLSDQNIYIDSYVYENNKFLNRLFFIENIIFLDDEDKILNNITKDSFNPKIESYINSNAISDAQISAINNIEFSSEAKVEVVSWEPDQIVFKTISKSPQLLFLSEIYYPGWTINNNNNIIIINGLFRGLIIEEGENEYVMKFDPKDFRIGRLISIIFYIFLLLIICFNLYKTRVKNV